jgi:hypothetical protein
MANKKILLFIALLLVTLIFFIILLIIFYMPSLLNPFIYSQEEINSNINEEVYIALYLGDIDGEIAEDWFDFYEKITDFYEENRIPVVFSFYPGSIQDNEDFNKQFLRMYNIENIELMQKGYNGDELEMRMDDLPFETQKSIIKSGQDHFREKMQEMTKTSNVKMPMLYNQIGSRFTEDTKKAVESLGFKFYFDVYIGDGLEPINSSETFDVAQYGVSFTLTGAAGNEEKFKEPHKIFYEINEFSREDLQVLEVNGKKFIPLWVHQQDFESQTKENQLDKEKWKIYTQTINALNKDPNVHLILPSKVYDMRH